MALIPTGEFQMGSDNGDEKRCIPFTLMHFI